jgi:hypothetical protein
VPLIGVKSALLITFLLRNLSFTVTIADRESNSRANPERSLPCCREEMGSVVGCHKEL